MSTHALGLLLAVLVLTSCKKANKSVSFEGPDALQGRDKSSEEPIGLPGYPLICQWLNFPTQKSPAEATIDCFLANSQREPVSLDPAPLWKIVYQGTATVLASHVPPFFRISMTASTSNEILEAMQTVQIFVKTNSIEKSLTVREAMKADAGQWRLGAGCDTLFSITVVNAQASFINTSVNRFDGCETLASRLVNVVLPNPAFRNLPDTHQSILASCDGEAFSLTLNTAQTLFTLGIFSREACQDLRALVNSLGI